MAVAVAAQSRSHGERRLHRPSSPPSRALGLSQEALAARLGIHVRNLGILERRWPCSLRPEMARRLACALEIDEARLGLSGGKGRP